MTLVEVKFRLQSPITSEQLRALAEFSNTYGLRRFHIDDAGQVVRFEYDASCLPRKRQNATQSRSTTLCYGPKSFIMCDFQNVVIEPRYAANHPPAPYQVNTSRSEER